MNIIYERGQDTLVNPPLSGPVFEMIFGGCVFFFFCSSKKAISSFRTPTTSARTGLLRPTTILRAACTFSVQSIDRRFWAGAVSSAHRVLFLRIVFSARESGFEGKIFTRDRRESIVPAAHTNLYTENARVRTNRVLAIQGCLVQNECL